MTTEAQHFYTLNNHKWLSYKILGSITVKIIQIDPQTADIWPTELFVTLS